MNNGASKNFPRAAAGRFAITPCLLAGRSPIDSKREAAVNKGYEPSTKVFDVVIKTTNSFYQTPKAIQEKEPLPNARTRIDLIDGLWIGRLPSDLSRQIIKACWPACYPKQPILQFPQLYSFVREYPSNSSGKWDEDKRLQECVGLSKLIYPASIDFRFAARVMREGKKIKSIIPIDDPARGHAFIKEKRSWHTESDLQSLQRLVEAWVSNSGSLSERVKRAFWYHEYALRTYYIDIRWTFIVTALEALINTGKERVSKQFKERVPQLCELLGVSKPSKKEVEQAYTLRSTMAHGGAITASNSGNKELYLKIEEILRETVKQSILKPETARIFKDVQTIREKLPVCI